MTFVPEKANDFLKIFRESKDKIRAFEGCTHLELLNDVQNRNIYFTYSHWLSEADLNNYRVSQLFKTTWGKTKVLFADKPEAWSVERVGNLPAEVMG